MKYCTPGIDARTGEGEGSNARVLNDRWVVKADNALHRRLSAANLK